MCCRILSIGSDRNDPGIWAYAFFSFLMRTETQLAPDSMLATRTLGNRSKRPWHKSAAIVSKGGRSELRTVRRGEKRKASKSTDGSQSFRYRPYPASPEWIPTVTPDSLTRPQKGSKRVSAGEM